MIQETVTYARVSSKEQQEGYSIAAQQQSMQEYALRQQMRVVEHFVDIETAKRAGRTNFGRMLVYLESNPRVKIILVEKTDRLYRNFRDYLLLEDLVSDLDIEVHLVKEGQIIRKDSRSDTKFFHGLNILQAKKYVDNLSEEVKKGMLQKALQGEFPCGKVPIGYLRPQGEKRLTIDPLRASLVRQMFESYADRRVSLRGLVNWAKVRGLVMPRSGKALTLAQVERTLKNPIYTGDFKWAGQRYSGKHEAIVSRDLFAKTQQAFKGSCRPFEGKKRFAFSDMITCANCGCKVVAEEKKGKYIYYHCTNARGGCQIVYVKEESLALQFGDLVRQISITQDYGRQISEHFEKRHSARRKDAENTRQGIQMQLGRIRRWTEEAYTDKLEGRISEDHWRKLTEKWEGDSIGLQAQMKATESPNPNASITLNRILELAQALPTLWVKRTNPERRLILDLVHSNFQLNGSSVSASIRKPFNLWAEGPDCLNKRG